MPKISGYPLNVLPDGHSYIAVDADVSDERYKDHLGVLNLLTNRKWMQKQQHELDVGTAAQLAPFTAVALGTGTAALTASEADHPGVWLISKVGANTGAQIGHNFASSVMISGGETAEFVFKPEVVTNINIFMGFMDVFVIAGITDGVFIQINAATLTGATENNTVGSVTVSSYTVSASTWYRAKIVLNSDATQADFYLYDMSGTELWHDSLTTNIPTAAGRETGFAFKAYSTTAGSLGLARLDWMAYYNSSVLTR